MKHGLSGSSAIHKINYHGKMLTAQHLRIGNEQLMLQYFLVRHHVSDFVLGKELVDGEPKWLGGYVTGSLEELGGAIEKAAEIVLTSNPDPFSNAVKSVGEVSHFNIDSIAVERVRLVNCDVTVSCYLFQVEDDTVFRLACFWFTLVDKKIWYPLMPMDSADIYHVSDMLMEYESGKHDMWCRMNEELVALLQHLENEKHRNN